MSQRNFFGTDGIRARVGSPNMHPEFLLKLGWAIGKLLKRETDAVEVLIGRDTRLSGEMIEAAIVSGFLAADCNVVLLGIMPTPVISYLTHKHNAQAGIIISASHNAFEDNGIKCINSNGMKFSDDWELQVEQIMQEPMLISEHTGVICIKKDTEQYYIQHCLEQFPHVFNDKLVIDCANGSTFKIAPDILRALGANLSLIHHEPNGRNINEQCGATDVASLQRAVVSSKADLGIAFDGDGDRLILVDHTGETVDGDEILAIIAAHGNYDGVVGTLMTNLGLEKMLKDHQMAFERADVGDRYVLNTLQKRGWTLGGEGSGHIINLKYSQTGDGILTALQILNIMKKTGRSLHDLKQVMLKRPQILINVRVNHPKTYNQREEIIRAQEQVKNKLGDRGRVLLRASGTESCVRVMVECDEEQIAKDLAAYLADVVSSAFAA